MRKEFNTVIVACMFLFLSSCASGSEAERQNVLEAVKKYNGMMRRAYMEANITLMGGVATDNQIKMLYPVISALQAEGSRMMADQTTFMVKRVSAKRDSAYVNTEETWVYWWQNKDTGEITRPEKTVTYIMRYKLVLQDGTWKVDSIEDRD